MIVNPLYKILEIEAKFKFNDGFPKAFEFLNKRLTTIPIISPPNWSIPFEFMCDIRWIRYLSKLIKSFT